MMKKYLYTLALACYAIFASTVFSASNDRAEKTNIKAKSNLTFDMYLKAYAGEVFDYSSYNITSPLAGLTAWLKFYFNKGEQKYQYITYKVSGEKYFANVEKSNYTLDVIKNDLKVRFGFDRGSLHTGINLSYDFILKPSWPDLYQPSPLNYNAAFNLNDVRYSATDRYTYHKIGAEFTYARHISNNRSFFWSAGLFRKIGTEDPSYDPAVPIRLSPGSYYSVAGEIGLKDLDENKPQGKFANTLEFRYYDTELARDAVTGLTHYATTPNPNYVELSNEALYEVTFRPRSVAMEVTPFAAIDFNIDFYQHYYTYIGGKLGVELKQKLFSKKLEYDFKGALKYLQYGANGYGASASHPALTDGQYLYKFYVDLGLDITYSFSKKFDYFIEADLELKRTNYPAYVPGVNPVSGRNYDIDFSYNNYAVRTGVVYHL